MSNAYVVGAKILGLYFLVTGVAGLPYVPMAYEIEGPVDSDLYMAATTAHSILIISAGLFLFLRYRLTDAPVTSDAISPESLLTIGVRLLGIYFLASGVISGSGELVQGIYTSFDWLLRDLVAEALYALMGALLVLRPAVVNRVIRVAA